MIRLTVSMSAEKHQALRDYSEKTGASMSSLANLAISTYLDQQNLMKMMPEMLLALKKNEDLNEDLNVNKNEVLSLLDTIETTPGKKMP